MRERLLGVRNSRACSMWKRGREGGERKVRSEVVGGHTAQGFGRCSGTSERHEEL